MFAVVVPRNLVAPAVTVEIEVSGWVVEKKVSMVFAVRYVPE